MGKQDKNAFTLVELIVVIAIIAILAAIIAPNAFKAIEKAKIARTAADLKSIKTAVLSYYADIGTWPNCHYIRDSTSSLITNPGLNGWDGPYLEKIGMSALCRQPGGGGCPVYGYYYVWWDSTSSGHYSCWFDVSASGNPIKDGVSVCVYGLSGATEVLKLDELFDGPMANSNSLTGIMNTMYPSCGGLGLVALLIGETGQNQP